MTPHDELERRLLTEARARESGRTFRRVLLLAAAGFVVIALGAKGSQAPIAWAAGIVLIVVAIYVLWQARKNAPPG